jgi:hypothetical protein
MKALWVCQVQVARLHSIGYMLPCGGCNIGGHVPEPAVSAAGTTTGCSITGKQHQRGAPSTRLQLLRDMSLASWRYQSAAWASSLHFSSSSKASGARTAAQRRMQGAMCQDQHKAGAAQVHAQGTAAAAGAPVALRPHRSTSRSSSERNSVPSSCLHSCSCFSARTCLMTELK